MSAENAEIRAVDVGESGETPGASVAVDTPTTAGTVAVGDVTIQGVRHGVAVTVYPASDVSALNVSSLGSKVRTALLSLV